MTDTLPGDKGTVGTGDKSVATTQCLRESDNDQTIEDLNKMTSALLNVKEQDVSTTITPDPSVRCGRRRLLQTGGTTSGASTQTNVNPSCSWNDIISQSWKSSVYPDSKFCVDGSKIVTKAAGQCQTTFASATGIMYLIQ